MLRRCRWKGKQRRKCGLILLPSHWGMILQPAETSAICSVVALSCEHGGQDCQFTVQSVQRQWLLLQTASSSGIISEVHGHGACCPALPLPSCRLLVFYMSPAVKAFPPTCHSTCARLCIYAAHEADASPAQTRLAERKQLLCAGWKRSVGSSPRATRKGTTS